MKDHIIVCPFDEQLLAKLSERNVVIKSHDLNILQSIQKHLNKSLRLHAIKIQTDVPLSAISFQEDWLKLPLAIYSPEFGNYRDLLHQLNLIRRLNIRIFLSSEYDDNYTGLKILSSLNINCGLYFNNGSINWEAMNDLMHYAVYSKTKHAHIEPFDWLVSNYEPTDYMDYHSVYFNNPAKYLHVNEKEQIALNEQEMLNNRIIGDGIPSLDRIHVNEHYNDFINARYDIMLQMNECAYCPAFRICLAKFEHLTNKNDTCKVFFSDFINAADYSFKQRNSKRTKIWQL